MLLGVHLSFDRQFRPDVHGCHLCSLQCSKPVHDYFVMLPVGRQSMRALTCIVMSMRRSSAGHACIVHFSRAVHADRAACVQVVESGPPDPSRSPPTPSCALVTVDLVLPRLLAGQPPRLPQRWTSGPQTPQMASFQLAGPPHPTPLVRPLGCCPRSLALPLLDRSP